MSPSTQCIREVLRTAVVLGGGFVRKAGTVQEARYVFAAPRATFPSCSIASPKAAEATGTGGRQGHPYIPHIPSPRTRLVSRAPSSPKFPFSPPPPPQAKFQVGSRLRVYYCPPGSQKSPASSRLSSARYVNQETISTFCVPAPSARAADTTFSHVYHRKPCGRDSPSYSSK